MKPTDFDVEAYAASSISGVLAGGETTEVRVRFDKRVAKAATAARVVADRKIERVDDGGVEERIASATSPSSRAGCWAGARRPR